jgi:hypothetical protein
MEGTQRLLLPTDEARAALGGIGHSYLYQLIARGELVKVRLGKRAFITADSVRALVERRTAEALAGTDA